MVLVLSSGGAHDARRWGQGRRDRRKGFAATKIFAADESFARRPASYGARAWPIGGGERKGAGMADGSLAAEGLGRLMAELRPRLHRYCARMVGSAIDGEDVVQEALAKAAEAFPAAGAIERPESWLFRIAHNAALDALRRRKRQAAVRSDIDLAGLADASAAADAR